MRFCNWPLTVPALHPLLMRPTGFSKEGKPILNQEVCYVSVAPIVESSHGIQEYGIKPHGKDPEICRSRQDWSLARTSAEIDLAIFRLIRDTEIGCGSNGLPEAPEGSSVSSEGPNL